MLQLQPVEAGAWIARAMRCGHKLCTKTCVALVQVEQSVALRLSARGRAANPSYLLDTVAAKHAATQRASRR